MADRPNTIKENQVVDVSQLDNTPATKPSELSSGQPAPHLRTEDPEILSEATAGR